MPPLQPLTPLAAFIGVSAGYGELALAASVDAGLKNTVATLGGWSINSGGRELLLDVQSRKEARVSESFSKFQQPTDDKPTGLAIDERPATNELADSDEQEKADGGTDEISKFEKQEKQGWAKGRVDGQQQRETKFSPQREGVMIDEKLLKPKKMLARGVARHFGLKLPSMQKQLRDDGLKTADAIASDKSDKYTESMKRRAEQCRKVIEDAPTTADPAEAKAVAAAKVQLDILSRGRPRALSLTGGGANGFQNVNQAYVLRNEVGPRTNAFVVKPAKAGGEKNPSGASAGGEVVREALAGQAATFMREAGFEFDMPETYVMSLPGELFPGADRTEVTCSVQQWGASKGDLTNVSRADLAQIDPKQVASLALFDAMTLASDRHAGNLLIGQKGELIPIDHGENFVEVKGDPKKRGRKEGIERLQVAMAGCNNVLLKIPAAHDPLPDDLRNLAKGIRPDEYKATLVQGKKAVAKDDPAFGDLMSDESIDAAARAAQFVALAADAELPLSPAAIQVALASNAKTLFDPALRPDEFRAAAIDVLDSVGKQQPAIKEVSLASDVEYELLCRDVANAPGNFKPQSRNAPTQENFVADPALMLAIAMGQIKPKPQFSWPEDLRPYAKASDTAPPKIKAKMEEYRKNFEKEQETYQQDCEKAKVICAAKANDFMRQKRDDAIKQLHALAPISAKARAAAGRSRLGKTPPKEKQIDFIEDMTSVILADQAERLARIKRACAVDALKSATSLRLQALVVLDVDMCEAELDRKNVLRLEDSLKDLEGAMTQDGIVQTLTQNYNALRQQYALPSGDKDVAAFTAAQQGVDVAAMVRSLDSLMVRAGSGEF
jgi:hypothetical protein